MIVLFDGIRDALERRGRMIELARNFNPQFWVSRGGVVINRDPAIGCDELAVFRQHQRIDLQRARFNAARSGKQFSNHLGELLRMRLRKSARRNGFIDGRIQRTSIYIARNAPRRGGALFDSGAAASGENDHRCAGRVIDGERKKKLPLDVDFLFDQHRFDWKLPHLHRQHARRVGAYVIWLFCERDPADTGAPGSPGLDFDDDFAAEFFRRCNSFIRI